VKIREAVGGKEIRRDAEKSKNERVREDIEKSENKRRKE
jgi:hypothetical protein